VAVRSITSKKREKALNQPRDNRGQFAPRELSSEELKLLKKKDAKKLAKHHAPEAVKILANIMYDSDVRPDIRVTAAKEILDRAEGKAKAVQDLGEDAPILRIIVAGRERTGKKPEKGCLSPD